MKKVYVTNFFKIFYFWIAMVNKDLWLKNDLLNPKTLQFTIFDIKISQEWLKKSLSKIGNLNLYFQEKTDKILNLLTEAVYENKFKSIRTKFKSLTESDCLMMWSNEFQYNISNFEDNLGGFEHQNLNKLFKHIYETKGIYFVIT